MDEMGKGFMEVFTSINTGGRLGHPVASRKRVEAFLEQVGGEGALKFSTMLNIGDAVAGGKLASCQPDSGEKLSGEEAPRAIDVYFASRSDGFEPYRKFVTRCLRLRTGSTMASFTDMPKDAKQKQFDVITAWKTDRLARGIYPCSALMEAIEAVELSPQNAYPRRLQHLIAERNTLLSRSTGKDPNRRVRIYQG